MTTFTIRVSQRVYYDVEVEAPSELEALRLVDRSINDPAADSPDFSDWPSSERDSGDFEIDAVQIDADGDEYEPAIKYGGLVAGHYALDPRGKA